MRALLFVVAFVVALLATAPLERWVLDAVREPLAAAGAELSVGSVRLALPAGVRATDVSVTAGDAALDLDSLYVGITRWFEAEACGGRLEGSLRGGALALEFHGVDPSQCLRVGRLELASSLDGAFAIDGLDVARLAEAGPGVARLDVTSDGGTFGGILVGAGQGGADLPLGEWEFQDLVLHATLADGRIDVREGHAETSGVLWELLDVELPSRDRRGALRVEFRTRQIEDTPRSRALVGLMPRATADAAGWRNYRVAGTLASPRVVAAD